MRNPARKILYIVNDTEFFLSHRLPIAIAAKKAGYKIAVAAPNAPENSHLSRIGFEAYHLPMSRNGTSLIQEIKTLLAVRELMRATEADLVHAIAIKAVLYTGLALHTLPGKKGILALTGLGYVFTGNGAKRALLRSVLWPFLRLALNNKRTTTIFQNADDRATLERLGVITRNRSVIIRGSGVDPNEFVPPRHEPKTPPVVMMASRLLRDKGVAEFAEAAKKLRNSGLKARFVLVGATDPGNPTAITQDEVQKWVDEKWLEWWGHRKDMQDVLSKCHIFCLPSYREGLPKVLLEAASCGRAIITSDCPGCREVVIEGVNGHLVPVQDSDALAEAIRDLAHDKRKRVKFGRMSREKLIRDFSINYVRDETLSLYRSLCSGP